MKDVPGMGRLAQLTATLALLPVLVVSFTAGAQELLPAKAHIEGVPFVGYHEVRDAEFPNSNILNPSFTAAVRMMYGYWGGDFLEWARRKTEPAGWTSSSGKDAAPADLKALLERGIPVHVVPATTPDAHRLYMTPKICSQLTPLSFEQPHAASGALGEMISLQVVEQLRAGGCDAGLNDSVILAARLLIGYDDERQVFVTHDPSLGPNLEVAYEQFERMWRVTGAKYWAAHPVSIPAAPPGRASGVRARTADDAAAVALFRAYGLEITGRYAEAIEAARSANAAFGDYALGHALLGKLLACSNDRAAKTEAKRELSRARTLCSASAQRRVADELGRDFHVTGCKGEMLGWYRP